MKTPLSMWIEALTSWQRFSWTSTSNQGTYMYVSVLYFGITTVLSLSYYVNRSYMSFQGSSIYITLCMALFALYSISMHLQTTQQRRQPLNLTNYTLRFLVTLPLSIALTHPYIPFKFTDQPPSRTVLSKYDTEYTQLTDIYHKLHDAEIPTAYAGDFANVIHLLFDIPAVNIFNAFNDNRISDAAINSYCDNLAQSNFDVILYNRPKGVKFSFSCTQFDTMTFKNAPFAIRVRHGFRERFPDQARKLDEIMLTCPPHPVKGAQCQ